MMDADHRFTFGCSRYREVCSLLGGQAEVVGFKEAIATDDQAVVNIAASVALLEES